MLLVEMIPSTTWGDNLRSRFTKQRWDELRKAQYTVAGHKCEVCGDTGLNQGRKWPVECHERWVFDEVNHIQKLAGLIALCPMCHECKHFGRTMKVGDPVAALQHLAKVNGSSVDDAKLHVEVAFEEWARRSKHEWTLDLSAIESEVK